MFRISAEQCETYGRCFTSMQALTQLHVRMNNHLSIEENNQCLWSNLVNSVHKEVMYVLREKKYTKAKPFQMWFAYEETLGHSPIFALLHIFYHIHIIYSIFQARITRLELVFTTLYCTADPVANFWPLINQRVLEHVEYLYLFLFTFHHDLTGLVKYSVYRKTKKITKSHCKKLTVPLSCTKLFL